MNMSNEGEDQEKTHQEYAQLLTELPKGDGWFERHVFLYQGQWMFNLPLLGTMLMQNHYNFRSDDIFLSSFMKTGNTWLKALMFCILNRCRYDFSDHPLLRQGPHMCVIGLEFYLTMNEALKNLDLLPSPRLLSTHLAHSLFPSMVTDSSFGCKFVYLCRDPKDVFVSKWHYMHKRRSKELPEVTFDQAFESSCNGVSEFGPYWEHVLGYWRASLEAPHKILFLKYEEMKKDPETYVKKLAHFMGVPISIEEEENGMVEKISNFCSFQNLSNLEINKTGVMPTKKVSLENHYFFRKGEVGDWKCHLTEEMRARIDQITQQKFKDSGLTVGATQE